MDRGTWQATFHGVAESDTTEWLSLTFRYSQCLCFTHYPETSMTSTVCWTFPMQRPRPSSLSATGWWSWHPLSWNHSCLSDSEQDNMYMSFSFAWWLLEKSIWFLLFLIYDKIHKNWMGMNYNLRRALIARVPASLLSRPITNHGCSPFFSQLLSYKLLFISVYCSLHFPDDFNNVTAPSEYVQQEIEMWSGNFNSQTAIQKSSFFFFNLSWEPDKCNRLGRTVS